MNFVYKTDNLFRTIRVSYGNSSVTKGFIFLKLFELHSFSVLKMHHSKPHHQFSTLSDFICYFSCIYWLFWAIRRWNWKAFQMNSEKVESWHGIIIWPTYHVQESRKCYGKNWMHFVYKTDNLFRSIRVSYGNSSVTKGFHFLNLFELHSLSVLKMHHSKPHHQFSTLSDFICYFSCIYWLFWAIRPWNWKAFQINSEKVESWHGIIIWPT